MRTLRALLTPVDGIISGHTPRRMGAQLMVELGIIDSIVMWFGRWGSSAVLRYIEDARARSKAGAELWWTALVGSRPDAWSISSPAGASSRSASVLKEFIVEESKRAAAARPLLPLSGARAGEGPVPEGVHFLVNRDTMKVHFVCPQLPGATLCAWSFLASGADWERMPSDTKRAQASHKGKSFDPCGGCRDAAMLRGWLAAGAAAAEAPSASDDSSGDEV